MAFNPNRKHGRTRGFWAVCTALRPRYKRLVDSVYPVNADEGLVKANMEKLVFYSVSSPEKIDRIGEYIYKRALKDLQKKRIPMAQISLEAMDQLLVACHAQTLTLFVTSFLRMVAKLLENVDVQLQLLASNSFVKYSNIEEDSTAYHRRYDLFIFKFSAMANSQHVDRLLRSHVRLAGLNGLQGVIRKMAFDDLVENIWQRRHLDIIVPALLNNMQTIELAPPPPSMPLATKLYGQHSNVPTPHAYRSATVQSTSEATLAETVLRELVARASFTHIRVVLLPIFQQFDDLQLWSPNRFAIYALKTVMISLQPQYAYTVVETLMYHLDHPRIRAAPRTRVALAVVLSKIIATAAGDSVGPSALDIINNLLLHLCATTTGTASETDMERAALQVALIEALVEFADHHPDYQKIEIMLFIMNAVRAAEPKDSDGAAGAAGQLRLQMVLLQSLRYVAAQYRTEQFDRAFPAPFGKGLLRMTHGGGQRRQPEEVRGNVMVILQSLLDRHDNRDQMMGVLTAEQPEFRALRRPDTPTRADVMFARKQGPAFMLALIDAMATDESRNALMATWRTSGLLVVELTSVETVQEFLLFVLGIQELALAQPIQDTRVDYVHRCNRHTIALVTLALIAHCAEIWTLSNYAETLMEARRRNAPHWLHASLLDPKPVGHIAEDGSDGVSNDPAKRRELLGHANLCIDQAALVDALRAADIDASRLDAGISNSVEQQFLDLADGGLAQRTSVLPEPTVSADDVTTVTDSGCEVPAAASCCALPNLDSTPAALRRAAAFTDEFGFAAMKRLLSEPAETRETQRERNALFLRGFREAEFGELMRRTEPAREPLQTMLTGLFAELDAERTDGTLGGLRPVTTRSVLKVRPIYEQLFPEMFFL